MSALSQLPKITAALATIVVLGCVGVSEAHAGKRCAGLGLEPTIVGTAGPDTIRGTNGFDVIRAGSGDDRIDGRGGPDYVCAGPGDDRIDGGDGNDTIKGGSGDDTELGGAGEDYILGQGGLDSADGGPELDSCLAETIAGCESDIGLSPLSYLNSVVGGGGSVYSQSATVQNGGSSAPSVYAIVDLPSVAQFAPDASHPGCTEGPIDRLTCTLGALDANRTTRMQIGFSVPDCPPPGGVMATLTVYAADQFLIDPFPDNNTRTESFNVTPAASCPA